LSSDKAVLARDPFPINANRNACDWAATIIALIGFDGAEAAGGGRHRLRARRRRAEITRRVAPDLGLGSDAIARIAEFR
jgi:hypothetical protein